MDIRFEPAPKTFKRVKSAKLGLTQHDGSVKEQEFTVWLNTSGTPTFCVSAPQEYRDAWRHHRSAEYGDHYGPNQRVAVKEGWVHAATFADATESLERLSGNYGHFLAQRNKRKVIVLVIETKTTDPELTISPPSFSSSRVLVGLRADVYWDVHGQLYYDSRAAPRLRLDESRDPLLDTEPKFADLSPASKSTPPGAITERRPGRDGGGIAIPFTEEAWRTVCAIEATLKNAAAMLHQLTGGQAQALLEGGMQGLLAGPATQGAEL